MKTLRLTLTAIFLLASILIIFIGATARAGDLDDGISKYTDDSIEADSELGEPNVNLSFIVLDAISSAKIQEDEDDTNINDGSGVHNVNSVVCEPGADCSGPIFNINIE
jgi:hypothetical protein